MSLIHNYAVVSFRIQRLLDCRQNRFITTTGIDVHFIEGKRLCQKSSAVFKYFSKVTRTPRLSSKNILGLIRILLQQMEHRSRLRGGGQMIAGGESLKLKKKKKKTNLQLRKQLEEKNSGRNHYKR